MSFGNLNPQSAVVSIPDPAAAQAFTTILRVPAGIGKVTVTDWWAATSDATPFVADDIDSVTFTLVKYDSAGAIAGTISSAVIGGTATWAADTLQDGAVTAGSGTVAGGESVRVQYDEAGTVAFSTPFTVGIDYVVGIGA